MIIYFKINEGIKLIFIKSFFFKNTIFQMFDDPPPRPFHTFKFPHIAVEVETTPQVTSTQMRVKMLIRANWNHLEHMKLLGTFDINLKHLGQFNSVWDIWRKKIILGLFGTIWIHLDPFGIVWNHLGPFRTIWEHLWAFVSICEYLWAFVSIKENLGPFGSIWEHLGPVGTS